MCKVRIWTVRGFCCTNLGFELLRYILGSRMQTSNLRICFANLGSTHNLQRLTIKPRASAATNPQSIVHTCYLQSQNVCTIDQGFVATDDQAAFGARSMVDSLAPMAELLCVCNRLWFRCHGWLSCFACAIDHGTC